MSKPDDVLLFVNATLDGKDSDAYRSLISYTGWTEEQFNQFYDTSNPESFGSAIVD